LAIRYAFNPIWSLRHLIEKKNWLKMEMLNSLNILAGKISPQNHDGETTTSANSSADHSPSSAR
jgi:hypothetical protein